MGHKPLIILQKFTSLAIMNQGISPTSKLDDLLYALIVWTGRQDNVIMSVGIINSWNWFPTSSCQGESH